MELLLENISHDELREHMKDFYKYAKIKLKITKKPRVMFVQDEQNSDDFFGKTGFYDPANNSIHLFITNRHPKDILRSFAHELIHHMQNLNGMNDGLDMSATKDPAYATHNKGLRKMEKQAFKDGNMLFRDWCDMKKLQRRNEMSDKKNVLDEIAERVLARLTLEAKKMPMKKDDQDVDGDGNTDEKVPAFLDKGDVKKKKGGKGKVPPQLAKFQKGKIKEKSKASADAKKVTKNKYKPKQVDEDASYGSEERVGLTTESKQTPYPELFKKKDRLLQDLFNKREDLVYQELMRKIIKEQK
jgi:hypothetical protein